MAGRTFEDFVAVRRQVPTLTGLFGPSGSGKSFTAGRLTAGMERVTKKPTFWIDTESNRALHYADVFKFRHVPFVAPFAPGDYMAAIAHCVKGGAGQIIIDSFSHVWEGAGGILEMHEAEVERMAGQDFAKRERVKITGWIKPKAESRRLINYILSVNCNFVFCLRAKEKLKPVKGKEPEFLGFQPIVGDEFAYEMTLNLFLPPGSNGVPSLQPGEIGERAMVKVPMQFRQMLRAGATLDEDLGAQLAQWATGGEPPPPAGRLQPPTSPPPVARAAESPEAAGLLKEITSVLGRHFPRGPQGITEEVAALRSGARLEAFGTSVWEELKGMPVDQLKIGLATLTKNLDGLASMREREPGEEE